MNNQQKAVSRARVTNFFIETFRGHSTAEYREFFVRGLNENNDGITGQYPWMYVRAFFALFILFTSNVIVFRITENVLCVPTIILFGGLTFTVPFFILLYEIYPKRDLNLLKLLAYVVIGGTTAMLIVQGLFLVAAVKNKWWSAVLTGVIEESGKALPALVLILIKNKVKPKNSYACFLIAAAVGAGFSIIEDMGYMFYYADFAGHYGDIGLLITTFAERGLSAFCTHVLWTGSVGWAIGIKDKPFRLFAFAFLLGAIGIHAAWDLPLDGWSHYVVLTLCVIASILVCITIIRKSLFSILAEETDLTHLNEKMIENATNLGPRMRFTNAVSLTLTLTATVLSALALCVCSMPIGMTYTHKEYPSVDEFASHVEGGYNLIADWSRPYNDGDSANDVEVRYIEGEKSYAVQRDTVEGYDGVYLFGYYLNDKDTPYSIHLELDEYTSIFPCVNYTFGDETRYLFEVQSDDVEEYSYEENGKVLAVLSDVRFKGYNYIIGFVSAGVCVAFVCMVITLSLTIKVWSLKDE